MTLYTAFVTLEWHFIKQRESIVLYAYSKISFINIQFALRFFLRDEKCNAGRLTQNELSFWRCDFTMSNFYPDTDLQSIFTSINNICVLLPNGYRCRMWNLWLLTTENVDCWTDKIRRPPSTRFHFGNKHFYSRLWHFKALSFLITYSEEVYTVSEFFFKSKPVSPL